MHPARAGSRFGLGEYAHVADTTTRSLWCWPTGRISRSFTTWPHLTRGDFTGCGLASTPHWQQQSTADTPNGQTGPGRLCSGTAQRYRRSSTRTTGGSWMPCRGPGPQPVSSSFAILIRALVIANFTVFAARVERSAAESAGRPGLHAAASHGRSRSSQPVRAGVRPSAAWTLRSMNGAGPSSGTGSCRS